MKPIILISTTLEDKADAERIARLLLERQLIACAQVTGPITSFYRWQGEIATAAEYSLSLKTTPACADHVRTLLSQEHPYDLPEIIVQDITYSSDDYSSWVHGEVRP